MHLANGPAPRGCAWTVSESCSECRGCTTEGPLVRPETSNVFIASTTIITVIYYPPYQLQTPGSCIEQGEAMTVPWEDIRLSNDLSPDTPRPYSHPSQRQGEPSRPPDAFTSQPTTPIAPPNPSRAISVPLIPTRHRTDTFPLEAITSVPQQCLHWDHPLQPASLPARDSSLPLATSPKQPAATVGSFAPPSNAVMDLTDLFELSLTPHQHDGQAGQDLIKMFGPEQVVQDPALRAYYESIIRDILICMIICTSIWVVLCLAVPVAGL